MAYHRNDWDRLRHVPFSDTGGQGPDRSMDVLMDEERVLRQKLEAVALKKQHARRRSNEHSYRDDGDSSYRLREADRGGSRGGDGRSRGGGGSGGA